MNTTSTSKFSWVLVKIAVGWLVAVAVAVSNHVFFSRINGENTAKYNDAVIIAAKNALAMIVQLLLIYVGKESLTQVVRKDTQSYLNR
jgi:hypothetical protein